MMSPGTSGTFISRRLSEGAKKAQWMADSQTMQHREVYQAAAQILREASERWPGSEQNWKQLRQAFAVLRLADAMIDDELAREADDDDA